MVTIWEVIKQLFCHHDWSWMHNVQESSLRTGQKHSSSVYVCTKRGRYSTLEHV